MFDIRDHGGSYLGSKKEGLSNQYFEVVETKTIYGPPGYSGKRTSYILDRDLITAVRFDGAIHSLDLSTEKWSPSASSYSINDVDESYVFGDHILTRDGNVLSFFKPNMELVKKVSLGGNFLSTTIHIGISGEKDLAIVSNSSNKFVAKIDSLLNVSFNTLVGTSAVGKLIPISNSHFVARVGNAVGIFETASGNEVNILNNDLYLLTIPTGKNNKIFVSRSNGSTIVFQRLNLSTSGITIDSTDTYPRLSFYDYFKLRYKSFNSEDGRFLHLIDSEMYNCYLMILGPTSIIANNALNVPLQQTDTIVGPLSYDKSVYYAVGPMTFGDNNTIKKLKLVESDHK